MTISKTVWINECLTDDEESDWATRRLNYQGKELVVRELEMVYSNDRADVLGYQEDIEIRTVPEEDKEEIRDLVVETSEYELEGYDIEFW